ncbi:hypothetical protein HPP92_003973 [Vanilla planifolia]|uniref:Uncharacterized protein n=1 Tax=Vanilla planifolia TaxID=51239 RepID=A0A835S4N3_VANPL|nr:hypothetical protein HPP92_003973 [Vanilla planifolia]
MDDIKQARKTNEGSRQMRAGRSNTTKDPSSLRSPQERRGHFGKDPTTQRTWTHNSDCSIIRPRRDLSQETWIRATVKSRRDTQQELAQTLVSLLRSIGGTKNQVN